MVGIACCNLGGLGACSPWILKSESTLIIILMWVMRPENPGGGGRGSDKGDSCPLPCSPLVLTPTPVMSYFTQHCIANALCRQVGGLVNHALADKQRPKMALLSSRALPIRSYSYRKPFSRLRFQDLRHLSQDLHDQSRVSVRQGTDSVEIKWNQGKDDTTSSFWGKYHHIWLRDNCQCPECYHPDTHQRLVDVLKISADLRPKSVGLGTGESVGTAKPSPQTLAVEWEDGHRSAFPLSWLQSHAYEWQGEKPQSETLAKGVVCRPTVWGKEISEAPPMVDYESFMKDDQTFLEWSDKVDRYGFCFIDGIPLETQYSKQVLERAGVLRHTFYGDFWDFEANSKADDDLDMG